MPRTSAITPETFTSFGELLRFLRRRANLTQRELAVTVGYSESQISRLEKNERAPEEATLAARFFPALSIEDELPWATRLLELGAASRIPPAKADPPEPQPAPEPVRHNLPIQLTSFIGREKEIAEIHGLLTENRDREGNVRLLTLTGHGGCGKTRLALQAASGLVEAFNDGIWLVELGPVTDPELVTNTLATVLAVDENPEEDLLATIIEHMRLCNTLLIFDNCEHVIQAVAELAMAILHACPNVYILTTSREMLGVSGERAMKVPSLSMPDPRHPPSPGQMAQFESVRLFVDRAANVIPGFSLTPENEAAIAQICRRLDGIPLAIELAAARLRMMPVEQIAVRLDDVFRLLTGGSRTALPRHQTLQALIDWSYDLLTDSEKTLFRRLAVFARSWTLSACEAVCADDESGSGQVLETLGHLIDKSLVIKRTKVEGRELRYRLLDTIRQYATTKLSESGEADTIRRRHAEYYFTLAEAGAPRTLSDYTQKSWLETMEIEIDNIRSALTWSLSNVTSDAISMRMDRTSGIRVSAWALNRLGWLARERGDAATAHSWLEQSLSIYRELDDKLGIAWTTVTLGEVLNMQRELTTAKALIEEGMILAREQNESQAIGWGLCHLGHNLLLQGDLTGAKQAYSESRDVFMMLGPHKAGLGWAYFGLAETALARKAPKPALENLKESVKYFNGYKNRSSIGWCLESMACALALQKQPQQAARFWGMSEALSDPKKLRKAPIIQASHEKLLAKVRTELGERRFKKLWLEKQSISVEQAASEVLAL